MAPRYRVTLTEQERQELEALTKTGKTNAKRFLLRTRFAPVRCRFLGACVDCSGYG